MRNPHEEWSEIVKTLKHISALLRWLGAFINDNNDYDTAKLSKNPGYPLS